MTDIASLARSLPTRARPAQAGGKPLASIRRYAPLLILAAFAALGFALGALDRPAAAPESSLALLLRFMAVLKGAAALGAAGLLAWRQRRPLGGRLALAYGTGVALMALAPGLIAGFAHIAAGAASFHIGLILFAVAALRDDGGLSAILPAGSARRRHLRAR